MNIAKTKQRKAESFKDLGCLLFAFLGIFISLSMNTVTVQADNAEMVDLPKSTNAHSNKIPGQYAFAGKVSKGITKVTPFGGSNADWATSVSHTEGQTKHWYAFRLYDGEGNNAKSLKGQVGIYYSNVGNYKGHVIDIKLTMLDWKVTNYAWVKDQSGKQKKVKLDTAYVAFGKDDFEIFTPGMGAIKYRIDYYDHDAHKPIKMTAAWSFDDIDGNQWVGIEPTTFSKVDQVYYGDDEKNGKTWLSYRSKGGKNYIFSDARQHNIAIKDGRGHNVGTVSSLEKKGSFTAAYSDASSFIINWVYGQNTGKHAVEEQTQLENDNSYWNMIGQYDPDADTQYKISSISSTVDASNFNHAYLKFGTTPMLKDKPADPQKFVSDTDEGTDIPNEVGTIKSVDHDLLKNRYENYHYQIMHNVPRVRSEFKYDEYIISDNLDNDLDISNVHVYNRESQDVTYLFTVNIAAGNNLSVIAKEDTLSNDDFYRQQYKVTFDAKVRPGVSLADHKDPKHKNQAVIYNTAKVTTSNGSSESNKTTTNIPFTPKSETKAVSNGKGSATNIQVDYGQDYKYTVDVAAPDSEDVKSIELKDKLEDVLNLKDVKVYDLDNDNKDVTKDGKLTQNSNTAEWIANDATKWHGKHLRMVITASVKNTPELMKYLDKNSNVIRIPNKALWIINGKDDPTNIVMVEPKGPKASVDKWIELPDLK